MVDLTTEAAGAVAIGGFVSLVAVLAGVTTLLGVVLSGSTALTALAFVSLTPLAAVLTAAGVGGLLLTWAAVASGYFEPDGSGAASEPPAAADAAETDAASSTAA